MDLRTEKDYQERIQLLNQAIAEADAEADFWFKRFQEANAKAFPRRSWWQRFWGC